jgi:GTP pyrophosphokinase
MLLTLNDDVRVILKIADRLHNMQTMESMENHKQVKLLQKLYISMLPLAHRLDYTILKQNWKI